MRASASVGARVSEATRALVVVRVVEALALATTAGGACFAAALVSGPFSVGDAIVAASIGAALAGLTWWREHAPISADVARRIDRVERLDGALVTAYEHENDATPLANLLARDVGAKLTRRAGLRAVMPRSTALFALPLAGAGAILLALEMRRVDPDPTGYVPRVEALIAGLEGLAREAAADEGASASAALAPIAAGTAGVRASLSPPRRDALESALRGLEERVAEAMLATRDRRLERAQTELARLRKELETEHAHDRTPSAAERLGSIEGSGSEPVAMANGEVRPGTSAAEEESSSAGASELAAGSRDGTMRGRGTGLAKADETMTTSTETGPRGAETRPEAGVRGARWWPERYDDVVARWIEGIEGIEGRHARSSGAARSE